MTQPPSGISAGDSNLTSHRSALLRAALDYAERGFPVFPCNPNNKQPLIGSKIRGEGGLKLASTDPIKIKAWWAEHPNAMIGIRTGSHGSGGAGFFAIDLDPARAKVDEICSQLCAAVERQLGVTLQTGDLVLPPPCPKVSTPRGGQHWYFAMPADGAIVGNRVNILKGQPYGIDVRGNNGYVIAPPSMRMGTKAQEEGCDGECYAWMDGSSLNEILPPEPSPALLGILTRGFDPPARSGLAKNPMGLLGDIAAQRYALAALNAEVKRVENAPKGERNGTLNNAAFSLGQFTPRGFLTQSLVCDLLEQAAHACKLVEDDGLKSVRDTIESGLSAGISKPRFLADVGVGRGERQARVPREDTSADGHEDGVGLRPPHNPDGGGGLDPERLRKAVKQPPNDTGNAHRLLTWFGDDLLNVDFSLSLSSKIGLHVYDGTHWEQEGAEHIGMGFAQTTAARISAEAEHIGPTKEEADAMDAGSRATAEIERRQRSDDRITTDLKSATDAADSARRVVEARRTARRKFGLTSGNGSRLRHMIELALPHCSVQPKQMDADRFAVNVLNGTLRPVEVEDASSLSQKKWVIRLDPHRREDLITKVMPVLYDPAADCPRFRNFMERCQPKVDNRAFLQRWHGLALTSLTEQAFVLNYGTGANGKTTFIETVARLHGSYAQTLPAEALTGDAQRRGDQATPELARLAGARLVCCAELPARRTLKGGDAEDAYRRGSSSRSPPSRPLL